MPRVKLVRQAETAECGLACVTMIANYFGHNIGLGFVRQRCAHRNRSPSLQSVIAVSDELSLDCRPVRLGVEEFCKLRLPAVLHWNFSHFVVLTRVTGNGIEICDPASGRRVVSKREVSESFTGVAVEFSRMDRFERISSANDFSLASLLSSYQGLGKYLAAMLLLLFVSQILGLAIPVATQLLIDEVVLGQDKRWLLSVIAGIGLVMLAAILIDTMRRRFALVAGIQLAADTAAAMVRHVLCLPLATIERRTAGDLMSRIDSMQPIQVALSETILSGVVQGVSLLTTLSLMLIYSPQLTLVSLIALSLIVAVQAAVLPRTRARNLDAVVANAEAKHSLIESLRGFAAVSAFGLAQRRLLHWRHAYMRASNARAVQGQLAILSGAAQSVVGALDQLVFLGLGIVGIADREMTLGMLFAMLGLRGRLGTSAASLLGVVRALYLLRSHVDRVGELLLENPRVVSPDAALRQPVRGAIRCSGLAYRYPAGAELIQNFDCEIEAGERVVICGPSGIGKSTLLRLLYADLVPDLGSLAFDGMDLGLWDHDALTAQFASVRQSDTLFMGSLADNISGFSTAPDVQRMREVAQTAAIWDVILDLPMKLQTLLTDGGAGFSGGQRQRILLARALYRCPSILFLDEATSQLDHATETRVLGNLNSLEMTIVSVAHGQNALSLSGRPITLDQAR